MERVQVFLAVDHDMADVLMQSPSQEVNGSAPNGVPLLKFAASDIILPPPDLKSQSLAVSLSVMLADPLLP
jgi:hypothetical protein